MMSVFVQQEMKATTAEAEPGRYRGNWQVSNDTESEELVKKVKNCTTNLEASYLEWHKVWRSFKASIWSSIRYYLLEKII